MGLTSWSMFEGDLACIPSGFMTKVIENPKSVHREALRIIYGIFCGEHRYAPEGRSWIKDAPVLDLYKHPFRDEGDGFRAIHAHIGSPGHSASQGKFIPLIAGEFLGHWTVEPLVLRLWAVQVFRGTTLLGYDIIAEAGDQYTTYSVGGMTDYSGEGGTSYDNMLTVFYHWAVICNIRVQCTIVSEVQYKAYLETLYKLEEDYLKERNGND